MGWELHQLGDICEIEKQPFRDDKLPYVGLEDIEAHTGRFLGDLALKSVASSTFQFSNKHVLYGRLRPYLNKVLVPEFKGHCSSEIFPLRPSDVLMKEFLFYWLISDSVVEAINKTCTGARMPRANVKELLTFSFPLPPIPEQKRIVALLDRAFADIEQARANTEKNLSNARDLFESYLQQVFSQRGDGWELSRLDKLAKFSGGGTPSKKEESYWQGDIPWVSPKDMKSDTIIDSRDHINEAAIKNSSALLVDEGAILMVVRSGILARTIPIAVAGHSLTVNQDLKVISSLGKVKFKYLYFYLKSKESFLLEQVSRGATVHRLPTDVLKELIIAVPSKNEQTEIISKCEMLKKSTSQLEINYLRKIRSLDQLKKSILQKAFSGKLTQ